MKKWLPPLLALVVFLVLLVFFFIAAAASRPPKVNVVAAARDLKPGDVLTDADLQVVEVYRDARAAAYVPADRKDALVGGVVLQPFDKGEPLLKLGVASVGTADARLIGLLADFPDMAIFPLPLDLHNVIAAEADDFHVGDIVGLTVVYTDRPSLPENPATAYQNNLLLPGMGSASTPTPVMEATPTPSMMDYTERGRPPVAKTFEQGFRVVAVLGQTRDMPAAGDTEEQTLSYTANVNPPRPILMLLVPQKDIEPLSLAVSQGQVFVSLALKVKPTQGGFSYWDFEQMLKEERERLLEASGGTPPVPMPTSTPMPTRTPVPAPTSTPQS